MLHTLSEARNARFDREGHPGNGQVATAAGCGSCLFGKSGGLRCRCGIILQTRSCVLVLLLDDGEDFSNMLLNVDFMIFHVCKAFF